MTIYERTGNNLVTIKRIHEQDIVLDRANCLRAIENVKTNRADYATEEAYQRHLAMYEDALAYFTGGSE